MRNYTPSIFVAAAVLASAVSAQCNSEPFVQAVGIGTMGTRGIPTLTSAVPVVGTPYSLAVGNGLPSAPGVLVLGGPPVQWIPLPAFCATLHTIPLGQLAFALDASGAATPIQLTATPASLCGAGLVAQAVLLDSKACGGLAFTSARHLQFAGGGGPLAIVALRSRNTACLSTTAQLAIVNPLLPAAVVHSFPNQREFLDVAVTPDGRRAVATNWCRQLVVLDLTVTPPLVVGGVTLPNMPSSQDPIDVDIARGRYAIATPDRAASPTVYSVDLQTLQIVSTLPLSGTSAESCDASPDGTFVLITSDNPSYVNEVRRIDVAANGVLTNSGVQLGTPQPKNAAISPRLDQAIVCNSGSGPITILGSLSGPMTAQTLASSGHPQSAVFHPTGDKAYVRSRGLGSSPDRVEVLTRSPSGAWAVTAQIPLSGRFSLNWIGVDMLAMTLGGRRLVVHGVDANGAGEVTIIDTGTDAVVRTIALPNDAAPGGVASIGL